MERADERVNGVTSTDFGTLGDGNGGRSSRLWREHKLGARKLGRGEYVEFQLGLGAEQQRLQGTIKTCQNCILVLEDDLHSISEQVCLYNLNTCVRVYVSACVCVYVSACLRFYVSACLSLCGA